MTATRRAKSAFVLIATILALPIQSVTAQPRLIPVADSRDAPIVSRPADYADLAGLALGAPVVADAAIRSSERIKGKEAVGLKAGMARFYVTADVMSLIRGPAGLPMRLNWLVDVPADAGGRADGPRKKDRVLIFARALPTRPTMLQLTGLAGQRPWSPDADRMVRSILTEALSADAPAVVTGVGNAFFVPGALPGEGETQVFLHTQDERPVSLSVVRNAGGQRSWSVALSEVTAAGVPPPPHESLLWYRLACALPARLPAASAVDDEPANVARAREDYEFVIQSLGRCTYPVQRELGSQR